MKLLLECFACDPSKGSESFNAWRWAKGLAEAGHEVDLLTTESGKDSIEAGIVAGNLHKLRLHVLPSNLKLWRIKFGLYLDYAQWLNRAAAYAASLEKPDVAHHISWGNVAFGTRQWRLDVPTVLGPCGGGQTMPRALFQHLEADRQFEILRTGLVKTAQRTVVLPGARLDKCHVLASNDATLEFARAKGVKSATFFEDPMLDERDALVEYQSRPSRTRPQVLWVGRMLPRKGVELVIKAFAKSKVEADLIVVGDGPRMARAREMVRNLSVEDRVKFTGEISRQEVGALMRSSDIFLFASLRDSMPAQLLEAMAAGLPIVCLDIYGNSRLVPDEAGIKVPVIDAEQVVDGLGRAVRELVQSQSARESMGRRAYLASLDQAWPKKVARMSEIYRTIVT